MTEAGLIQGAAHVRQPTKQERLRTMLLEMPLSRAELLERTGWAAKQLDKAIEYAVRQGSVIPLNMPGRTRRCYAVPGFVPHMDGAGWA